jgi:hypothetical protein
MKNISSRDIVIRYVISKRFTLQHNGINAVFYHNLWHIRLTVSPIGNVLSANCVGGIKTTVSGFDLPSVDFEKWLAFFEASAEVRHG